MSYDINDGFLYRDREDAALQLLSRLAHLKEKKGVVFAVPRGGIPMGRLIADAMGWPLEPLLIKKIGHPVNPEYAIGAVAVDGSYVIEDMDSVSEEYIRDEVGRLQGILLERQRKYFRNKTPVQLDGAIALVVDDGIATGRTLEAGVRYLRGRRPQSIIIAVPVAPPQAIRRLRRICDDLICLNEPEGFTGVGQYYENFKQVEDEEVERLLVV